MAWILTALSGALTGVVFCLLLLLMLRYSRTPIVIGPIRWQGLLHHWYRNRLRDYLSSMTRSLDLQAQIRLLLLRDSTREQAEAWLGKQVDAYMTNTLPEKWPMASLLIGEKTQEKVRMALSDHIRTSWQPAMETLMEENLSNEQIRDTILQIAKCDQPEHWSEKTWQFIFSKKWPLLLLFLSVGLLIALINRFIYVLLHSL